MTTGFDAAPSSDRPLYKITIAASALMAAITLFLFLRFGRGVLVPDASAIVPMTNGFVALCGVAVCFLAFGRFKVLREPVSFWVGTSFAASSVMLVVYVLSFPSILKQGGEFVSLLPGPPAWILGISQILFSLLFLPATFDRQPTFLQKEGRSWIVVAVVIIYLAAVISAVLVLADRRLPAIVDPAGFFAPALYLLEGIALPFMGWAIVISLRRYRKSGEPLHGFAALSQIFFFCSIAVFFLSVRRFDVWWCCARVFAIGVCLSMLTGLLSGYISLFRRERENLMALRGTIDELNRTDNELRMRARSLAVAVEELESFSYSVSHDLRTQLHILTAFAYLLREEFGDKLGSVGDDYLNRIARSVDFMNSVIQCILKLSRISQHEIAFSHVPISAIAAGIIEELRHEEPGRVAETVVYENLTAFADESLVTVALGNLIRNAWKFSGRKPETHIEIGCEEKDGQRAFFVRDSGAGFDMTRAESLFRPFKRLHSESEFPGSGIGLAIVSRAIKRHGGRVWAESQPGLGACFYFTLSPAEGVLQSSSDAPLSN
jgi:signal transduction histidine kinase